MIGQFLPRIATPRDFVDHSITNIILSDLLIGTKFARGMLSNCRFVPLLFLSIAVVGDSSALGQLAHRYSFTSDATDSVGTADGTVIDSGTTANFSFTGGMLDFSANGGNPSNNITEDAYLDLPNGIVSAAAAAGDSGEVTFEWWYTLAEERTWQRVGDFGNSNDGEDTSNLGSASDYLSIVATSGRGNIVDMTNHTAAGAEPAVGLAGTATLGVPYHVIASYDANDPRAFIPGVGTGGTMSLYVDGALVGRAAVHPDFDLNTFEDVNNWLGRSQWPDPLFDGSYDEFRIYNAAPADEYAANSFEAGPDSVPAFVPKPPQADLSLVVDRDTGTFTLMNEGPAFDLVGISITSASGALDPENWLSVTENYDFDDGGSFDPDDEWQLAADGTPNALEELEVLNDGGQLGTGGTQTSLQLGAAGAWTLSSYEDLVVSVDRLLPDFSIETIGVRVEYVNGLGQTAARSDLDFDGDIDADDWVSFAANHFGTFEEMTIAQASLLGDMDGDLDNDYFDFLEFEDDFDAANGAGALAAVIAGVPEPTGIAILLMAGLVAVVSRRKVIGQVFNLAIVVTSLGLVLCGSRADAQVVGTASDAIEVTITSDPEDPEVQFGNATVNYSLQNSGNTLVFGTYLDAPNNVTNLAYNGIPADGSVMDDRVWLSYYFDPAATGDFTFDVDFPDVNFNGLGAYFIAELRDVDTEASVDLGMGSSITTTADDRFVINYIGANNTPGDTLDTAADSIASLIGVASGGGDIGGGSIGAAMADARFTGAAGMKTLGWEGFGGGFANGEVSAAFTAPPILIDLTLVVNKDTGEMRIRNETGSPVSFDYYSILSEQNALDPSGWISLDAQNVDFGLPTDFDESGVVDGSDLSAWETSYGVDDGADANGDGSSDGSDFLAWQRDVGGSPTSADGWIEAGMSSNARIGELYLEGATSLGPGEEVVLGTAYDTTVFGAADGDLLFEASSGDSTQLLGGFVVYESGAVVGAVPEPTSLMLVLMSFGVLASKRR